MRCMGCIHSFIIQHAQLHVAPPARLSSQLLPLTTRAIQMEQAALLYQKDNEIKDLNLLAV